MKIIGICGQSGSGKSSVCQYFAKRNIPVLDCDAIYHDLVSHDTPCLAEIGTTFGKEVICDGALNRKRLREIVFHDPEKLHLLNQLTHRFVKEECNRRLTAYAKENVSFCLIDAPMLFEAGMESLCDAVVAVIAPQEEQLSRLLTRDRISTLTAKERIDHQISQEELIRRADFVIDNNADLTHLESQCEDLLKKLNNNFQIRKEG